MQTSRTRINKPGSPRSHPLPQRASRRYAEAVSALGGNLLGARVTPVRLREIDPDFLRYVPPDERQTAGGVALPAVDVDAGPFDPHELLAQGGAFCAVVMAGMVDRRVHVADQVALRLLGPGALIATGAGAPEAITKSEWSAASPVRLGLLGTQFLRAVARWPQLQHNIMNRFAEQNEHLAAQLALCQMPRVEDRLLAMLWLLAETWGKVTSAGTVLPLRITHEALGAMVGARRPTVTLALSELADSGAVLQRPSGWLLLKPPPDQRANGSGIESPQPLELQPTAWAASGRSPIEEVQDRRRELLKLISQLREEHQRTVVQLHQRLRRAQAIRTRAYELRDQIHEERRAAVRCPPRRSSSITTPKG
jgi:CRP/FNR family cyclic AMP-dependent transcriptional regulator